MQTWWSHSGHVGEGKRTFTSFSQGTRTKKMEESGRKGRGKKIEPLIARCSRYFESVVLLSIIFLVIAAHGIRPSQRSEVLLRKEKKNPASSPIFIMDKHYWSFGQFCKWKSGNRVWDPWQETMYSSLINDFTETLLRSVNKRGK